MKVSAEAIVTIAFLCFMAGVCSAANAVSTQVSVIPSLIMVGSAAVVSGSGFAPTGNVVHFSNTATGDAYEVGGLTSDGKKITVAIPLNARSGPYAITVKGLDAWSDPAGAVVVNPQDLSSTTASSTSDAQTPSRFSCPDQPFNTNMAIGSRDGSGTSPSDPGVAALQSWLLSEGYDIHNISKNIYPKGYFGTQTADAVTKFQSASGIPATGYFGRLSRAKANASCGFSEPTNGSPGSSESAVSSEPSTAAGLSGSASPASNPVPVYSSMPLYSPRPTNTPAPAVPAAPVINMPIYYPFIPSVSPTVTVLPSPSPITPAPSPITKPAPSAVPFSSPSATLQGSPYQANIMDAVLGGLLKVADQVSGK